MDPTVTAIVVARTGAEHLTRTLTVLTAQTRPPDAVIVIADGSSDAVAKVVADAAPTHFVVSPEKLPYGAAVAAALRLAPAPTTEHQWLWLLAQDTAAEPDALRRLLDTVEVSPSVAVAGPKIVDWDDDALIRELGESMTPLGASVALVQDELDQAQHDGLSDVLAVVPAGMIVRHTVWDAIGGFDPGLAVVDDGLDFCVRARLAGHRVVLVPDASVASAGDGIAGPSRSNRWANRRRLYRERRKAQLHRRMVYAPAAMLVLHWLSLVPLAVIRSIGWLLGKQPGAIGGELAAAFAVAFGASGIGQARAALARVKTVGWSAIAPLRIPLAEVRRARALRRESELMRTRGERVEFNFFSGGGAWTVIGMLVVSIGLFVTLLGSSRIGGGALLPLNDQVAALWQNTGYGWRDIGLGFAGTADPFTIVLAILGSLTFWQPSLVLVLLWLAALPLAALGAWFCATRITTRPGLRALFAILWALAPMLLDALQSGRPAAVLAHLLLPWLFFAGYAARRSWAASATTALLTAAVLACAPSLAPALAVLWVIWLVTSGRRLARVIMVPLPAIVLFAPLVLQQLMRGNGLAAFADPGAPLAASHSTGWQLALGGADAALGGWGSLAASVGLAGQAPTIIVAALLAPIVVLALLALFLRGTIRATLSLIVALLGFATAVAAGQLILASNGSQHVAVWPGAGLSLYWLGLSAAAVLGLAALGRFAVAPAWVALVAFVVAVAPLAAALPLGNSAVAAAGTSTLPAYVTAEAGQHPRIGTLRLTPQPGGELAVQVVRGIGETLDVQSTLSNTRQTLSRDERSLAVVAGNLASSSGMDAAPALKRFGIDFVLLAPPATVPHESAQPRAAATTTRAATALDGNPLLATVGTTEFGQLWSVTASHSTEAAAIPADAGGWLRPLYFTVLGIVFGAVLLLSIPTGRAERGVLRRPTAAEIGAVTTRVEPEPEPEPEPDNGPEPEEESVPVDVAEPEPDDGPEPEEEPEPEDVTEPASEAETDPNPDAAPARRMQTGAELKSTGAAGPGAASVAGPEKAAQKAAQKAARKAAKKAARALDGGGADAE